MDKDKEKEKVREQYRKLLEEEEKLKFKMESEVKQGKLRLRKDFVRQLELERRQSALSGVILKAQEVAILQQKQLEQEEKLAAELNVIRRKEIVDEKLRQHLRENSHELKALESQLKAAYVTKALTAQMAEKEENKLKEQIREKHAREVLEKAIGTLEEQEEKLRLNEKKEKEKFKQSLQDQIILKERMRQEEFMAFMKEKKMFDNILHAIKDGEMRELERKKLMQQKLKEEMQMFQKAKDVWKAKERLKIQEEEARRKEINEDKERARLKQEANKKQKEGFDRMFQEMSKNIIEKQAKRADREELVSALIWNEKEEEEKRKLELEKAKDKLRKEEARSSFKKLLAEKARKEKEEKELDSQFAQIMKAKTEEEERKEREKQEQRRTALINNRKYNEEAVKLSIQKRAEGLKLKQLINELQENEEKKREEMIEEERIRILKAHAHRLLGYFPKGCLRESDLEILGLHENFVKAEH